MCERCYLDTMGRNAKKYEAAKKLKLHPPDGMDMCVVCKHFRPLPEFEVNSKHARKIERGERARSCKSCRERSARIAKEYRQEIERTDKERHLKILAARRDYSRRFRVGLLDHYGRQCVCCGETTIQFLELHHKNGDGGAHRKEIGAGPERLYRWCEKNGWPPILEAICGSCHTAESFYGGCPHKQQDAPAVGC